MRYDWGQQMKALIKPGGFLITLIFPIDPPKETGPPFFVRPEHYIEPLGDGWEKVIDKTPPESLESSKGRDRLIVWKRLWMIHRCRVVTWCRVWIAINIWTYTRLQSQGMANTELRRDSINLLSHCLPRSYLFSSVTFSTLLSDFPYFLTMTSPIEFQTHGCPSSTAARGDYT